MTADLVALALRVEHRDCCRCERSLPLSAFKMRSSHPHMPMPWCIECKRAYDQQAVATKRAALRARAASPPGDSA